MNVFDRLQTVPPPARKLLGVIARQASRGPLLSKRQGTAAPPEILEACGLDVGEFYALLDTLEKAGLIRIFNDYPFEEIEPSPDAARACVTLASFHVPADRRYFEDYEPGRVYEFGSISVSETEIIEFARQYDPQPIHTDPAKAAAGEFGGIIASGFHTVSLAMRLFVDHYISHVASLASPGVDEIRWPKPLRPGDTIRIRVSILEARPSRSKPDRGIVRARIEAVNQHDDLVMSMTAVSILARSGAAPQVRADPGPAS